MREFLLLFLTTICGILSYAQTTERPPNIGNIMPLGDSRVAGDRPSHESYRFELWKLLIDAGWGFDFIGSQSDAADYPSFQDRNFDRDHEGIDLANAASITENLDAIVNQAGIPDIVLLGVEGTNLTSGNPLLVTINNLNELIDKLQELNPQITIFIEQVAPPRSDQFLFEDLKEFYDQLIEEIGKIAVEQTDEVTKVIAVDLSSNWSDDWMADEIHYNETGAREVANRYFNAISQAVNDGDIITSNHHLIKPVMRVSVYPNPVVEEGIYLDLKVIGKAVDLELIDAYGRRVKWISKVESKNFFWRLEYLPRGYYYLKITDGVFYQSTPLVKH